MLTLHELNNLDKKLLQAADGPSQADVYQAFWQGRWVIIKDYSKRPWLYKQTVCRWQFRREWLALLRLRRVPHVPRPICRLGEQVLVMTRLNVEHQALNYYNARALECEVSQMHAAGVAHNDLHSRNLMLDPTGAYLFDFGTAWFRPWYGRGLRISVQQKLFELCCAIDRMAVIKYELKHNPAVVRHQDQQLADFVAATRWMSRIWYRIKRRERQTELAV